MDWEFQRRPLAGDNDAASKSRIIIEGDHTITPLEIFVREVLQNSLDARCQEQKVRVRFKLHSISNPGPRTNFLTALGWSKLRERVGAANRIRLAREEPAEFGDPQSLENSVLKVLEISEAGTIGLVGPEAIRTENEERRLPGEPPKAYIALTRDDARREKQGLGSGGTYGLGKAVLWSASQIQTVVFFSRLAIPHGNTTHRAAAQARLGPHFLSTHPYRGLGYGGDTDDEWCRPICNDQAQSLATRMGVARRENETDSGTTILIPFWSEPPSDEDENLATHAKITRYAARYFWPAIVDGRLEVTAENEDGQTQDADEHLTHYQPFISLYQRCQSGQRGSSDVAPEKVAVTVPAGPPPHRGRPTQTFAKVAMAFVARDGEVREDFSRKVACIRGQGMVVGYAKMTGNTLVRPFVGIALGGRAADTSDNGVRGDVLLGFSEYVTHTRWDEKSASLRHWPDARPVIRELLKKLRDYFERNSRVEQPESTGDLSPLEEILKFPGVGRIGPQPEPPRGQPQLRVQTFNRENNRFRFELRARVEVEKSPCTIEIWVEPAMETGSAAKGDRFGLESLSTVPPNLGIEVLSNGKLRVSVPTLTADTQIRIAGVTELLPPEVFAVSEGVLKASLASETGSSEPEQVGEDNHA